MYFQSRDERYRSPFGAVPEGTAIYLRVRLPRAWQWLDGSAFLSHGERMQRAFHLPPIAGADQTPLMYQGLEVGLPLHARRARPVLVRL